MSYEPQTQEARARDRRRAGDDRVAEDSARARRLRGANRADRHARRRAVQDLAARRGHHRHDAARRRRHRARAQVQAARSRSRSDRHHRPGQHSAVGRSGEGRRVRLPREAGRCRAPARQAREGDQAEDADRRERAAQGEAAGPLQVPERHRQEQEDAGAVRADRERGRQRGEHPDPGRERHRQGADRQRDSLQQQAVEGTVHQDQLRRDSRRT